MNSPAQQINLSDAFIEHALSVEFDDFPQAVIERAHQRLADALGNIAAGTQAEGMSDLVDLVTHWGGVPEATVLANGTLIPAHNAAMINAALMRSFDFEPVGAEGPEQRQVPAHITGTTVPVALAVAEARGSSGRDMLTALLVGEDIAARLAFGSGFDVYSGQDNTGTVNGVGAVFIAGLLMGLTQDQLRHALGIVVNQLAGSVGSIFDGAATFKLPMSFAARNAIISCEMAQVGMTGQRDPLSGMFGFLDSFCADPKAELMIKDLGRVFYADAVIKPWSACRASHPSLDAAVRLVENHGVRAQDVEKVTVHVTPRTKAGFVGKPFAPGPNAEVSAAFSIHFAVATALLHGTVRPEFLGPQAASDPHLQDLLERTEIEASLAPEEVLTAEVEVLLKDGTTVHQRVADPRGDIYTAPLSREQVLQKFRANLRLGGQASQQRQNQLLNAIETIESAADVQNLIRLAVLPS
ncbi:MmgE/PrpD family protein [Kocuria sp. cx-455]|uniref:MmgE/PrpD family protein n=1 Tax=Kocuria sp. cx-455 TaxID=2771377 RepID=UPI003D730E9D